MICSNCGADIGDNETACPYCGAMQYENSEQKYMKDLYNLNEGMEKLDKNTRKYIIKSTMKSVGIVCAAIAAAVLAGSMFGYGSYKSMYNSSHNRKEIHKSLDWYNNNIGELNSLYEKRDYAGISELTDSYKGSSSVLEKHQQGDKDSAYKAMTEMHKLSGQLVSILLEIDRQSKLVKQ